MAPLPPEIINTISSFLPPHDLKAFRLSSRLFWASATHLLFKEIRLSVNGHNNGFSDVAKAPHLRQLVRKIKIDASITSRRWSASSETIHMWLGFIRRIHRIRAFPNATSVALKLDGKAASSENPLLPTFYALGRDHYDCLPLHADPEFRYWILWTIFSCLDGTWNRRKSQAIFEGMMDLEPRNSLVGAVRDSLVGNTSRETSIFARQLFDRIEHEARDHDQTGRIVVEGLAIANLQYSDESRLSSTPMFRRVMSSVVDLKLYGSGIVIPSEQQDKRSLRKTWLAPEIANRLKRLALGSAELQSYQSPNILSDINIGRYFPELESLSLRGCMMFAKRLMSFPINIGNETPEGGLRELHLDDCLLMHNRPDGYVIPGWADPSGDMRWDEFVSTLKRRIPTLSTLSVVDGEPWRRQQTAWVEEEFPEWDDINLRQLQRIRYHSRHGFLASPTPDMRHLGFAACYTSWEG